MRSGLDRDGRLGSLVEIAEQSLGVLHLAETSIDYLAPSSSLGESRRWLTANGYDAAPIADPRPHRYFALDFEGDDGLPLAEAAAPIDAPRLCSSSFGLADGVGMLREQSFYFVLEGNALSGIVTRADLQRPAVGMVLLALVLAAEAGMGGLIEVWLPTWEEHLTDDRRRKLEVILEDRRRRNVDIALIECLMLGDRLKLIGKSLELVRALGFEDPGSFRSWKERLTGLRDTLAHGGSLLDAERDPLRAIDLFADVRRFELAP